MKPTDMQLRFEELCAGHAIGDLTSEEVRELATLCQQLGASPDQWLDLLAAAVHADALEHSEATLPPHLAARLHQWADETSRKTTDHPAGGTNIIRTQPSAWRKLVVHPITGWVAAAAVLLFSLVPNRDPQVEPPAPPAPTAEALPTVTDSFKIFAAALTAAGLEDTLKVDGSFTIFAPTDEAFAKLPKGTIENLLRSENKEMLNELISHHVVVGEMPISDALASHEGRTLHGSSIIFHVDGGRVKIGESTLLKADIEAPNSMVHVIDRVLMPRTPMRYHIGPLVVEIVELGDHEIPEAALEELLRHVTITAVDASHPGQPRERNPIVQFLDGMEVEREHY